MRFSLGFRAALVALFALAGAGVSSAAHADGGTIWIEELKGGWFIGGSAGSGTLIFHGRRIRCRIAMPVFANAHGDIFGGCLLSQMDLAGSAVAVRRANGQVATVAVTAMSFQRPVFVGDEVSCYAENP